MGKKIKWTRQTALAHLTNRGYLMSGDGDWIPDGVVEKMDRLAADYLTYEWDFGRIKE